MQRKLWSSEGVKYWHEKDGVVDWENIKTGYGEKVKKETTLKVQWNKPKRNSGQNLGKNITLF